MKSLIRRLISSTVDYSAAEMPGGSYQVTVMADNGLGHTGSATFTWNVTNTDQAPVVDNPGDATNVNGDTVSLKIGAYDPDGDTLTYNARKFLARRMLAGTLPCF